MKISNDSPIYRWVRDSIAVVETTHFERYSLRDKHAPALEWEWWHSGVLEPIGNTAGHPVAVELRWATIEGKRYMFYFPCSEVVDRPLIQQWLAANGFDVKKCFTAEVFDAHLVALTHDKNERQQK
jgi:hypothetical protein